MTPGKVLPRALAILGTAHRVPFPTASEVLMRSGRHFVEWQGEHYTAEPLKSMYRVTSLPPVWAVSHGGEFIGTLPCHSQETTKEFEIRCIAWLRDLYGSRRV
jgi:hypothetical protein